MSTAVTGLDNVTAALPLLQVGMMVFDCNARQQIIDAVQVMPPLTVIWRDSVFSAADCWLVCGEKPILYRRPHVHKIQLSKLLLRMFGPPTTKMRRSVFDSRHVFSCN